MAQEIETKILEVDPVAIEKKMRSLGARELQRTRLVIDWYRPAGVQEDEDPWYLRIRKTSQNGYEMSWKSLPVYAGNTRQSEEINLKISDPETGGKFLEAVGMEQYAHQEKDRVSWEYKGWAFDLDAYPHMPPYLEIEGTSAEHVAEAIGLLGLGHHQSISKGERLLIQNQYGLNWYDMRF